MSKISDLVEKLNNIESNDPYFLEDRLQYLRNRLFYVHARIETGLEFLLIKYLTNHLQKKTNRDDYITVKKAQAIFNELSFSKKLDLCKKYEKVPNNLYSKVKTVNKVRNFFAHPAQRKKELEEYNKDDKYSEILDLLLTTLNEVNKLYVLELKGHNPYTNIWDVKFIKGHGDSENLQWNEN